MKLKTLIIAMVAGMLAMSSFAADNSESESLFNKEVSISLGTGYVLDTAKAFQNDYSFNLAVGAQVFVNKYIGAEISAPFYQSKGVSFEEVSAGLVARLPLGHIAPYVGASAVYQFNSTEKWAYIGKGGAEWRFNPKWAVFAEYQYRNVDTSFKNGSQGLFGGLKLVF